VQLSKVQCKVSTIEAQQQSFSVSKQFSEKYKRFQKSKAESSKAAIIA
jgi:hypothetical protein